MLMFYIFIEDSILIIFYSQVKNYHLFIDFYLVNYKINSYYLITFLNNLKSYHYSYPDRQLILNLANNLLM